MYRGKSKFYALPVTANLSGDPQTNKQIKTSKLSTCIATLSTFGNTTQLRPTNANDVHNVQLKQVQLNTIIFSKAVSIVT